MIPLNKSRIIHFGTRVAEAVVGNSEIADVIPLTDKSIYVLGKSMGSTSLSIYGPRKTLIEIVDVQVTPDTSSLKRQLYELMPQEQIGVGAAGRGRGARRSRPRARGEDSS